MMLKSSPVHYEFIILQGLQYASEVYTCRLIISQIANFFISLLLILTVYGYWLDV